MNRILTTLRERRIEEIRAKLSDPDAGKYPLRVEDCRWLFAQLEQTRAALEGVHQRNLGCEQYAHCWCSDSWFKSRTDSFGYPLIDYEHESSCQRSRKALGI